MQEELLAPRQRQWAETRLGSRVEGGMLRVRRSWKIQLRKRRRGRGRGKADFRTGLNYTESEKRVKREREREREGQRNFTLK